MEYERIQKVQTGMLSPSKLRMVILGSNGQKKKDKSPSNSSRVSPTKLQDSEFVKNSLLAPQDGEFEEEAQGLQVSSINLSVVRPMPKENEEAGWVKTPQLPKMEGGNSSMVHPVRNIEENLDYDSNASSSSFEFHKGDSYNINNNRSSLHSNQVGRTFQRQRSSKWNDAEKWIMNKQDAQINNKKNISQNQMNRVSATNMVKVSPESVNNEHKLPTKRVNFSKTLSLMGLDKFSFEQIGINQDSSQANKVNASIETCPQIKDLQEVDLQALSSTKENSTGIPTIRSVSMRDMGTEMTPIPSQEPSRTATPVGATTPLRSPTTSVPSTPRGGAPTSTPVVDPAIVEESNTKENGGKKLSDQDLKDKTRKEIVALGVQLGKMNIAAWASKDVREKGNFSDKSVYADEINRVEYERRALAWKEAETSKNTARFKHEDIKIQAWESQQKAKLEAEMRRIEARVEHMRAQAQAKVAKKISIARQRSEAKRATAEAKRKERAERTAAQAEYIRQTGKIPFLSSFICCGWLR